MRSFSDSGPLVAELQACPRLGSAPYHGWVWCGEESDEGVFNRAFRYVLRREHFAPLCYPDSEAIEALRNGVEQLERVAPELARSTLSHTHLIALFSRSGPWEHTISSSQFRVVGVVFLARELLDNPWLTAEYILHESLHQKIYDLRHAHSILLSDVHPDEHTEGEPRIVSLWNRVDAEGSNRWDLNRSLAALHVYTHVAVYASLAELASARDHAPPGFADKRLVTAESAWRRASYLAEGVRRNYSDELGLAGRCLLDWSVQCLELIRRTPSGARLRASLLLERYAKEIDTLNSYLCKGTGHSTESIVALLDLLNHEVIAGREVLVAYRRPEWLDDLNQQLAPYLASNGTVASADSAPSVRHIIRKALERTVRDPDETQPRDLAHGLIQTMIEHSSDKLIGVLSSN
jgi:hypothetical protein